MAGRTQFHDDEEPFEVQERLGRPATTPEEFEKQVVLDAMKLAHEQILNKTVSSQVLTHFVRLGSSTEQIDQEKKRMDIAVAEAKIEQMKQADVMQALLAEAVTAMRSYAPAGDIPEMDNILDAGDEFDVEERY